MPTVRADEYPIHPGTKGSYGLKNPSTMGFLRYNGGLQQSGPSDVGASRGQTPEGFVPMPPYDKADNCIRVPLHSRKYSSLYALIDAEDADLVNQCRWHPQKAQDAFYAQCSGPRSLLDGKQYSVLMHRFILGLSRHDPDVDHINGDGLDNRKENLRLCSDSQNQANRRRALSSASSSFRGVTWNKSSMKWQAGIKVKQKSIHLGLFDSEERAAFAYNQAATAWFGEFAVLNEMEAA